MHAFTVQLFRLSHFPKRFPAFFFCNPFQIHFQGFWQTSRSTQNTTGYCIVRTARKTWSFSPILVMGQYFSTLLILTLLLNTDSHVQNRALSKDSYSLIFYWQKWTLIWYVLMSCSHSHVHPDDASSTTALAEAHSYQTRMFVTHCSVICLRKKNKYCVSK